MKLVAQINAGNTVELIEGCIAHHRALGIDAFVILHIHSDDGTPELLRTLEQTHDDIAVVHGKPENLYNQIGQRQALDLARAKYKADWVLRVDSDERWFAKDGSLKSAFSGPCPHSSIIAPRYNVVWPTPEAVGQAASTPIGLEQLHLAMFPVTIPAAERDTMSGIPWVLTLIAPKCAVRGHDGIYFTQGGHAASEGAGGPVIEAEHRSDILVAQLAFTGLTQFTAKLRGLPLWCKPPAPARPPGEAWHWDRLTRIRDQGPEAIEAEWARQFLTAEAARHMIGREVIVPGASAFARIPH